MLRDAYQPIARPTPRRAIREAVLLSSCAMVLLFLFMARHPPFPVRTGVDSFTWLSLFLAALLLSPFLCLFRAGLIMQGDRRTPLAPDALTKDALTGAYQTFLKGAFCRNMLEGTALAFAAIAGFFFAWNLLLIGLFVLAAIYLLLDRVPTAPSVCDFSSLRARYQRDLLHQEQLRRFLRWLWFAPVLVALQARLAATATDVEDTLIVMLNCVAAAILCFLVAALNREHGGRVQEQIGTLDRMRES
jgi:Na+/H+ antiporter NhaD/arsenite permease-like protein